VKRIKLKLAPGVETEFVDRDRALARVVEWAEKSTRFPVVVFGPEGCGKSAFLRQAAETLGEFGYDVVYVDAAHRDFVAYTDVAESPGGFSTPPPTSPGLAQLSWPTWPWTWRGS
jgi:Archaeal ATPase.